MNLPHLSHDVLCNVFEYCSLKKLLKFRFVWRAISHDMRYDRAWRRVLYKQWLFNPSGNNVFKQLLEQLKPVKVIGKRSLSAIKYECYQLMQPTLPKQWAFKWNLNTYFLYKNLRPLINGGDAKVYLSTNDDDPVGCAIIVTLKDCNIRVDCEDKIAYATIYTIEINFNEDDEFDNYYQGCVLDISDVNKAIEHVKCATSIQFENAIRLINKYRNDPIRVEQIVIDARRNYPT